MLRTGIAIVPLRAYTCCAWGSNSFCAPPAAHRAVSYDAPSEVSSNTRIHLRTGLFTRNKHALWEGFATAWFLLLPEGNRCIVLLFRGMGAIWGQLSTSRDAQEISGIHRSI